MPASETSATTVPGAHPLEQLARARAFVVLVKAHQRHGDLVAVEAAPAYAACPHTRPRRPPPARRARAASHPRGCRSASGTRRAARLPRARESSGKYRVPPICREYSPASPAPNAPQRDEPPQYTRYRAGRRLLPGRAAARNRVEPERSPLRRAVGAGLGGSGRITGKRVALGLLALVVGWVLLSLAAVPGELALRARLPALRRRERARPGRLSADLGQHHPRARLRPPPEEQQGTRRRNHGPGPLGHDHADPHRRRAQRRACRSRATRSSRSPATACRRSTPPTPSADPRDVDLGDRALAGNPDQPPGRSELRKLPRS